MRTPFLLAAGSVSINMTPMIDVVFLLIIFFLVSSHLAKQENSVPLDLPKAVSVLPDQVEHQTMVINVKQSGEVLIGGTSVSKQRLLEMIHRRVTQSERQLQIRIRTDSKVTYDRIEPILGAAAEAGCTDVVFAAFEDLARNRVTVR